MLGRSSTTIIRPLEAVSVALCYDLGLGGYHGQHHLINLEVYGCLPVGDELDGCHQELTRVSRVCAVKRGRSVDLNESGYGLGPVKGGLEAGLNCSM